MFFVFLGLALADLGFLATWLVLGFEVHGDPALALRHQIGGLMVCILTVFVHSVTFVYFLGTGLAVKEARKNWGISADFIRHTRGYKLKAYPIAMTAIGLVIATGILGGAAKSGSVPVVVHRVLGLLATATSIAAYVVALRLMLRNGFMMALIRGEVATIKAAAARGEIVLGPGGARPELLKRPDEVKKAPSGFLAARACLFLALSIWGLFLYFWVQHTTNGKWAELGTVGWIPFAAISLPLFAGAMYLKSRHPLPTDVDFEATMKLGAHVSVAGGLENGPIEGKAIGAEVIQIFTRNQRQWIAKPVTDEEAATFRASVAANSIECVMSHASYLLNLGAPSADARRKSAATFREELARCAKLGVQLLNFHPGAHLGGGDAAALDFIADCVRDAIETTPDADGVTLVIENTAGQGSCVGHRFEHLAELLAKIGHPDRLGVCLDTQHSFAAGYDVKSEAGLAAVLADFDRIVGFDRLRAFHLNDSKVELGKRVDRHECLGKGAIGFPLFARLMNDPRFATLPGFLETPGGPAIWKKEIAQMRKALSAAARSGRARPTAASPRARARRSSPRSR